MAYTTAPITKPYLKKLHKLAKEHKRTIAAQLEILIDKELNIRHFREVSLDTLPHPPGADAVPLVYVKEEEK